jgi:hypothetical protein
MELKTGKVKQQNQGVGKGSLTCADGMLYCRAEAGKGTLALVEARAHPLVCGGKLYLRDADILL